MLSCADITTAGNKIGIVGSDAEQGISTLARMIINGETSLALNFIKNGSDLRAYQNVDSIKRIVVPNVKTTYVGGINLKAFPLIILAAASGQDEIIKAIKEKDNDAVYLKDFQGNDALMWASREGHVSTVKLLLSYGFDPLFKSEKSQPSAYDLALNKDKFQVLDVIIAHLIQKKQTKRLSEAIWFLSSSDETTLLEKYLKLGIKDSYKGYAPRTSLMIAAEWGKLENFKLLVQYGSDPYESNIGDVEYNYDPLTCAIGNEEFVVYLLENYDYNLGKSFDGKNYLQMAYNGSNQLGQKAFLLLLKKSGLDINSVDNNGRTLMDYAVFNDDIEYVRFFVSLGMNEQTIKKAKKKTQDLLEYYEKELAKVENAYDRRKMNKSSEINQLLEQRINLGFD